MRNQIPHRNWVMLLGTLILIFIITVVLTSCTAASSDQLSFVGPSIEGVRVFTIIDLNNDTQQKVLTNIRDLGEVFQWFPDGKRVVVLSRNDSEYYVADVDSGILGDCLTCGFENTGSPQFSPNGEMMAWAAKDGIYLLHADNYEVSKVADAERPIWLSWGDDRRLVFNANLDGISLMFLLDVESGKLSQLTHPALEPNNEIFAPAWSPGAEYIAFHWFGPNGHQLMRIDSDGGNLMYLTDVSYGAEVYGPGHHMTLHWSPDREQLLFYAVTPQGDGDIFLINADGSGLTNLTNHPGGDMDPTWSPDGKQIAFVTTRDGNREIYVMNADGSDPLCIPVNDNTRDKSRVETVNVVNPTNLSPLLVTIIGYLSRGTVINLAHQSG